MPETAAPQPGSSVQVKTAITIVAVLVALAYVFWNKPGSFGSMTPMRGVGLALALVGLAGWITARIQLGKSFSIQAKAIALVTQGIYSKIRNPVYVFGTIFIAGVILAAGRPVFLLVLLVLIPMQIIRARKEAKVLEAKFGDAYRSYRARTWF